MRRRFIALFLVSCTVLGLLSGCGGGSKSEASSSAPEEETYVTRGEWISMLGEAFGLDSYEQTSPYFGDVPQNSELYPYVQSAKEWGMLSVFGEQLQADNLVTLREVAVSAAVAAGMEVPEEGEVNADAAVDYAIANGIIGSGSMDASMTREACEEALLAAQEVFFREPATPMAEVVPAADLVDLTRAEVNIAGPQANLSGTVRDDGDHLTALVETTDGVVEVEEGDVFVTAPTREKPSGVAYKVSSIQEVDGQIVFSTTEPTLEDLFDELHVNMTVKATADNIIWEPGIDATPLIHDGGVGNYQITLLSNGFQAVPLSGTSFSKDFKFGSGSFEKNWTNKNSSAVAGGTGSKALEDSNFVYTDTPSIDDFKGGTDSWTKNLKVENKFSGGYQITGNISINSLEVTTEVEYNKFFEIPYGIKTASVQVNSDISATLTMQGNLSEHLKIATIPIPIATTGLNVEVDLFLYADASGKLQVTAALGSEAKVEYDGSKIKQSAKSSASAKADMAIELDFGAQLTATLDAVGVVKIMDASVKAGGNIAATAFVGGSCEVGEEDGRVKTVYQESMNIKADLYVPLISVSVGKSDTLIKSLGLTKTWDIMTKDKGAKHFELLSYEWVFWEETVYTDAEGNVEETETNDNSGQAGPTDASILDLTTYTLTLNGESKQLQLDLHGAAQAPAVTWSSSDPNVARVDQNGVVSPVSTGTATITVALQSDPSVTVRCVVYVQEIGEQNWEFLSTGIRIAA